MSYTNSVIEYNNAIKNLWKTEFKNTSNKTKVKFTQPCFHVPQSESPVWFIGMNPSFVEKSSDGQNVILTQNSNLTENLTLQLIQHQREMHDCLPYFKKARDFFVSDVGITELATPIFHDLYPIRHTKQNEFEKFLDQNSSLCDLLDEATVKLITGAMPDLIIIANAGASRRIQRMRNLFQPNVDRNATTLTFEANGKKTDVIFSSMLSGQRALDIFSRSRLAKEVRENWNSRNNK